MTREVGIDELIRILRKRGTPSRSITAIAGPPGVGKSTLADHLADRLNESDPGSAAVLPMDGYHFDDIILNARGWRPRKGAPHTFDVGGFAAMLMRLRKNDEDGIAVPVFDRSIEIARNSARIIDRSVRHLIVEGNYLLLDDAPWSALAPTFDTTVMLEVPIETIRARLEERWKDLEGDEKTDKLDGNDLPNAETVISKSRAPEFTLTQWQMPA